MPRRPIIRSNSHFYHITARANNRENFYIPLELVWEIAVHELRKLQIEFKVRISAFVLMNNHFHLLILTPEEDIDRVMYFFMKKLTLEIQRKSGRINKIFGGRYKGSIIENERYLLNVYKYIYRNPVAAGLVEFAEDYVFSTLFYQYHSEVNLGIRCETLFEGPKVLEWINESFDTKSVESISKGLKKSIFSYASDRSTGKTFGPIDVVLT